MPVQVDFTIVRNQDVTLPINLAPATSVSGWSVQFQVQHHFGGISGYMTKSLASGFAGGVSGITLVDGVQGRFSVAIRAADTSGLDFGNHAFSFERLDSGFRTSLSQGFLMLSPGAAK